MSQGVPLTTQEKGFYIMVMMPTLEDPLENRLTLHIQQQKDGQADPTTLVRWCVSREFVDDLRERRFTRPYLMLVVRSLITRTRDGDEFIDYRQDAVYIEPLDKEARYISFKRYGDHEIRAVVVNAPDRRDRRRLWDLEGQSKEVFYRRSAEVDEADYESGDSEMDEAAAVAERPEVERWEVLQDGVAKLNFVPLRTCENVNVPKGMFAKDYPRWIQTIVRRFFSGREKDQCHFRRRALLCIPILAFWLTVGQAFKIVCACIAAFFGIRSSYWRDMIMPIRGSIRGPLEQSDSSFWFWSKKKDDLRSGNPIMLFNPVMAFVPAGIVFGLMQLWAEFNSHHYHAGVNYPGWWDTLLDVDLAIVSLVGALVAIGLAIVGLSKLLTSNATGLKLLTWLGNIPKRLNGWMDAIDTRADARYQRKLKTLICDNLPEVVSYEAIPKSKRTIKLRFNNTKAKICRPFAQ